MAIQNGYNLDHKAHRRMSDTAPSNPAPWQRWLGRAHHASVHRRRVRALVDAIAPWLPEAGHLLDIGCGDGAIAALLAQRTPRLKVQGCDVLPRSDAAIDVLPFDGLRLPLADRSVDVALLVDVLHHTDDPCVLLAEAARVARAAVIIKDHRLARPDARLTLSLMDWVGNRPHGVRLPYNYWPESRWREAWRSLGLTPVQFRTQLGLYPWPASWLFESGLHFLAQLQPPAP